MRDNSFFQAICRVGIFMICAQAMVHFRPQEAYEKYLKLLVGVMVLIQLFLPIGSFLLRGGGQEAARLLEQFQADLERDMREAAERAGEADALLEQMTLEEVMRQLEGTQEVETPGGEDSRDGVQNRETPGGEDSRDGVQNRETPGGEDSREGVQNRERTDGEDSQDGVQNRERTDAERKAGAGGSSEKGEISVDVKAVEPVVIMTDRE